MAVVVVGSKAWGELSMSNVCGVKFRRDGWSLGPVRHSDLSMVNSNPPITFDLKTQKR